MTETMTELSFLVGLKNNLDYTKFFYEHTRRIYPENEIVFVSYGSSDGTHRWLEELKDDKTKCFFSEESKTFSDTYNKAIQLATKPYVAFLHNDMVLGKSFLRNAQKSIADRKGCFFYYSVVDPPVFGDDRRDWKTTADFGFDLHDFKLTDFLDFEAKRMEEKHEVAETEHTSFFLCIEREILLRIGGLDPLFAPMFCEDDDLILRLRLSGLKSYLMKDAITYHFVSKTSRFSEEYAGITKAIEAKSSRNFVRKWKFPNYSTEKATYDIGMVLKKGDLQAIRRVEPFASTLYTDIPSAGDYIGQEQADTTVVLKGKIKKTAERGNHDVMVVIHKVSRKTEEMLNNLSAIIGRRAAEKRMKDPLLKRLFDRIFRPYKPEIILYNPERLEKNMIKKAL